jgi:membrane protease YdiL (CAAX protease family)
MSYESSATNPPPAQATPSAIDGWLRPELVASWGEFAGVLLVLLAPFIVLSAWGAWHGSAERYMQTILSDRRLLENGLIEAGLLGLGLVYLNRRGWKPADLRIRPGWVDTFLGFLLDPVTMVANSCVVVTLYLVWFAVQRGDGGFSHFVFSRNSEITQINAAQLSWTVGIAAMVLNAFYEEIICTSYAFNQIAARRGPAVALAVIVPLRMACHTYQGPVHMLGIGAVFFVFGLFYWWRRNVWMLIVAHALIDIGSLSLLKLLAPFLRHLHGA